MTDKQFLVWLEWRELQWNRPSRSDWYLMQIACEVCNVLRKVRLKLHLFRIPFKRARKRREAPEDKERRSQAFWFGLAGKRPPDVALPPDIHEPPPGLFDGDDGGGDDASRAGNPSYSPHRGRE